MRRARGLAMAALLLVGAGSAAVRAEEKPLMRFCFSFDPQNHKFVGRD